MARITGLFSGPSGKLYRKFLTKEVGEEWGGLQDYVGTPLSILPSMTESYENCLDDDGQEMVRYVRTPLTKGEIIWFTKERLGIDPKVPRVSRVGLPSIQANGNPHLSTVGTFDAEAHKSPDDAVEKEVDESLGLGKTSGYSLEDIHTGPHLTPEERQ